MKVSDVIGKKTIDLNVDIGEGFPFDRELLRFASSANICCGVHAGSQDLTAATVELCRRQRVRVGAHPGYPDRENMGRRPMEEGQEREYLRSVFEQVRWFVALAKPEYIKPHGAFYNDTAIVLPENWQFRMRTKEAITPYDTGGLYLAQYPGIQSLSMILRVHKLPLMGLRSTAHAQAAERSGQTLIHEGFADRAYTNQGTLAPRGEEGAVFHDPKQIREQVLRLAPEVDSICLHGDTPSCVQFAELVYKTLVDSGYGIGL
ncbi:MAG: 5-oxoprolinase subunit PxpA [Fimbriimonas sp.]